MLSDFDGFYSVHYPIDAMPKPLVAKTTSDSKGFYEINLAPGSYSIFLLEDGELYARGGDAYGGINSFTINSNEKLEIQLILDHAVYWNADGVFNTGWLKTEAAPKQRGFVVFII